MRIAATNQRALLIYVIARQQPRGFRLPKGGPYGQGKRAHKDPLRSTREADCRASRLSRSAGKALRTSSKPQSAERNSSPSKRRLKRLTSHWQMKSKSQTPAGRRWAEKWLPVPARVIFIIGASAPHSTSLAGDTRCRKRNGGVHWRRGRNHVAPHRKWPSLDRPRYAQTNRRSRGAMSEMGHKSPAKIHLCPLLSKSGQTRMRSDCPLSANSGYSREDLPGKRKTASRRSCRLHEPKLFVSSASA